MATSEHSLTTTGQLPHWATELASKYRAGEASPFLLHHNVFDLIPLGTSYVSLLDFLQKGLLSNKGVVLYNRSQGIIFGSDETERALIAHQRVADPLLSIRAASDLPRDPARALPMIERYLYYGDRVAVIINFLDTIMPAGEISYLSNDDRNALVLLQRWMPRARLLESDNLVILVAESVADVH